MTLKKNDKNPTKQDEMVTDFGTRKINTQNFSKTVVIPKTALENFQCGKEITSVDVQLVQTNDEKYIKLVPVCPTPEKEEVEEDE